MAKQSDYKGESWKWLKKIMAHGYSRDNVFRDWLDLMLTAQLSLTDNIRRGNFDALKFDGKYNDEYMKVMGRYDNKPKHGERPADCFAKAYACLLMEIENSDGDPLGELYMVEISYGEHGQFFTPYHVARMMAEIVIPEEIEDGMTINDPSCGDGTMLIEAGNKNRKAILYGTDLDEICAKMCTLNMLFRGFTSHIFCGNTLTMEMYTEWRTGTSLGLPWVSRHEIPKSPEPQESPPKSKQLSLI